VEWKRSFAGSRLDAVATLGDQIAKTILKKRAVQKNADIKGANVVNVGREVSAMAWVENEFGQVLMVRQAQGNKLWTLPGGKARRNEEVSKALEREVREETGLSIAEMRLAAVYDRVPRNSLAVLFFVKLKVGPFQPERVEEIIEIAFKARLPAKASPSARFFWEHRRAIQKGSQF
jgi:ADP-ribose pyrophosphatase YjhB (NUDIX family)